MSVPYIAHSLTSSQLGEDRQPPSGAVEHLSVRFYARLFYYAIVLWTESFYPAKFLKPFYNHRLRIATCCVATDKGFNL